MTKTEQNRELSIDVGAGVSLSIAAVERDTGLSKDTLRVWERRYGFPQPQRDALGERAYSIGDVEKLRVVRRLLDAGHRPGRIIRQPLEALQALASQTVADRPVPIVSDGQELELRHYIDLVCNHEVDALRGALSQASLRLGIGRFVMERAAPLNMLIGEAWARGEIQVYEEHLYTESMQVVLRNAIANIPSAQGSPRVLLTTFPNEPHGLGLLMAEALLALDGCHCTSLGVQTPLLDIARAAQAQRADIVALSFSAVLNPNQVIDGLAELRAMLPDDVEIWAGGQCPVLQRRPPDGVLVLAQLAAIPEAVADWRNDRSQP
jgi:DNA-binding transcriptional MerR regulator/methylmalonyl-CoA mutase cobalamin-binding subunit